ncbi:MAG TPA: LysR family transcriptional regulator [Roseiflexaceae bacterium]|nr:LysR family transcriptional regulator [Roseiflexaceae bacterium]
MDLAQLVAFERVAREGSFSRAARALDLAQPTISARIQQLEQDLGGPLFVRGGRRPLLTELGESFLPYARRTLELLAEGVDAARQTGEGRRGRVTVGTLPSLAAGFLASAVARFHASHPLVDLYVRTGHSDQINEMLHDGVVKLGLIGSPFFDADLLPIARLREPLVLAVAAGHPLAGRGPLLFEEVRRRGNPFLMVRWGVSMHPVLARVDSEADPLVEVPIDTVQHLLRRGVGAAFLTRTLIADDLAAGRLAEVPIADLPPLLRESVLVRLARGPDLTVAARDFVAVLREEAGSMLIED